MKADEVYVNTMRMMGVKGLALIEFKDALALYPKTINPEVKQNMINKILGTVVMEKTLKQWFEFFVKQGNNAGARVVCNSTENSALDYLYSRPYKMDDFDLRRIEKPNVLFLIQLILQEYYKNN